MVRNGTDFYRARSKCPFKDFIDIFHEQADSARCPLCPYRLKSFKPTHGFVQVKKGTVYFQFGNMNAAIIISENKMFGSTKSGVEVNTECAIWNV